jgi:hypothetical protein
MENKYNETPAKVQFRPFGCRAKPLQMSFFFCISIFGKTKFSLCMQIKSAKNRDYQQVYSTYFTFAEVAERSGGCA